MGADTTEITARSTDARSFSVADASGSPVVAGSLVIVSGDGVQQLALVESRSETEPRSTRLARFSAPARVTCRPSPSAR